MWRSSAQRTENTIAVGRKCDILKKVPSPGPKAWNFLAECDLLKPSHRTQASREAEKKPMDAYL
jgi:hypothetical protein